MPYIVVENSDDAFAIQFSENLCPCTNATMLAYTLSGAVNPSTTKPALTSATFSTKIGAYFVEQKSAYLYALPQPSAGQLTINSVSSSSRQAGKPTTLQLNVGLENALQNQSRISIVFPANLFFVAVVDNVTTLPTCKVGGVSVASCNITQHSESQLYGAYVSQIDFVVCSSSSNCTGNLALSIEGIENAPFVYENDDAIGIALTLATVDPSGYWVDTITVLSSSFSQPSALSSLWPTAPNTIALGSVNVTRSDSTVAAAAAA